MRLAKRKPAIRGLMLTTRGIAALWRFIVHNKNIAIIQ